MNNQTIQQQQKTDVETLYPDLNQRLSIQAENKFVTEAENWQVNPYFITQETQVVKEQVKPEVHKVPIVPVIPGQDLRIHSIKSFGSWQSLVKDTVEWINKNIHPTRIISISVILHHSTKAGQCNIFYNNSNDDYMKMKIKPVAQCFISAAIVQSTKNWDGHHSQVMKAAQAFKNNGGVLCLSQLETGLTHSKATSIIWFMQRVK